MASKSISLDDDILNTLTDEERAAMAEDDVPGSDPAPGTGTAAAADADSDDADDADDDGDAAAAPPIEGKGASDAPAAADAVEPAAEPAAEPIAAEQSPPARPAASAAPAYSYKLPDDFQAQVDGLKEKESALWSRFDGGELSREELQRELSALGDDRQRLRDMQFKADLAADMQRQQAERTRDEAVGDLFARAARADGGGIDYRGDKAKLAQLDSFLKALAADEANEDKSLQWFLDEAHKRVLVLNGRAVPTSTADPAKAKADAVAKRKPDTDGLGATLAHVPGGQGTGDVGGEFDDILALDGEQFEEALSEMARKNPQRFARFQATTRL